VSSTIVTHPTDVPHPTTDLRETREASDLAAEMTACRLVELLIAVRTGDAETRDAAHAEIVRRRYAKAFEHGRMIERVREVTA